VVGVAWLLLLFDRLPRSSIITYRAVRIRPATSVFDARHVDAIEMSAALVAEAEPAGWVESVLRCPLLARLPSFSPSGKSIRHSRLSSHSEARLSEWMRAHLATAVFAIPVSHRHHRGGRGTCTRSAPEPAALRLQPHTGPPQAVVHGVDGSAPTSNRVARRSTGRLQAVITLVLEEPADGVVPLADCPGSSIVGPRAPALVAARRLAALLAKRDDSPVLQIEPRLVEVAGEDAGLATEGLDSAADGVECVDLLSATFRAVRSVDADDVNELVEQHEPPPARHPRLTSPSSGVRRSRS
jgi:hypothetical protein